MKILVKQISKEDLTNMGVFNWPIWTCEVSEFPWTYSDNESCFIIDGEIEVKTQDESVHIGPGDFIVFPKGLSCKWKVTKPVRKYYSFG